MARWAVIFDDSPEMSGVRARQDLRDAHVAYVTAHPALLIGGGLKPNTDAQFCGALWIVEADTKSEVEDLICADPFYIPEFRRYSIFMWGKILENKSVVL